ncbi:Glyoxylase, beta-lactamase superfamily II [Paenibacillus sp. 1_12]|uniref:MBL fold metallo-hydrolase n=1 Tax=Paenibacillus sp. 1_12 TaxID=1566278 RepID=UPI0008E043E3|nr:MBL fold metallo-hydrolase [Paenibacillus sp. 1_12]SFL65417.1 Glyoxylase, beta-lactamase superfamily II [Paenibacillus sp. 1_12]
MKIVQISEHIWACKIWLIIPITVWIVKSESGLSLVDAGIPLMAGGLLKQMERMDAPLERILLTHGHSDHVGSIKKIRQHFPVPVYAHADEIPYMEGKLPYLRRSKAEASVEIGLAQPLAASCVDMFSPDFEQARESNTGQKVFTGSGAPNICTMDIVGGLTPYLTPGHSPGHIAYYHQEDNVLLAGDLFTAGRGKLKKPMAMFTGDMQQAIESSSIIEQLKPKIVSVCHGGEVNSPYEQYESFRRAFK